MIVVVGPPQQVRPGAILNPPLVIRLDRGDTSDGNRVDTSRLFGLVSVTSADGSTSLAPPRNDLVAGRLTNSIRTLNDSEDSGQEDFGYLTYSDIRIQDPGRYRLRVSLMRFDGGDAPGTGGAMNIQSTLSDVIRVDNSAQDPVPSR